MSIGMSPSQQTRKITSLPIPLLSGKAESGNNRRILVLMGAFVYPPFSEVSERARGDFCPVVLHVDYQNLPALLSKLLSKSGPWQYLSRKMSFFSAVGFQMTSNAGGAFWLFSSDCLAVLLPFSGGFVV